MSKSKAKSPIFKPLKELYGIGPARSEALKEMGLKNVYDALFHLPRRYEDRRNITKIRDLQEGLSAVISGHIININFKTTQSGKNLLEVYAADNTGAICLTWFNARPSWADRFNVKDKITAFGKIQYYKGPQMVSPDYWIGENTDKTNKFGSILPIYPAAEGLSQHILRKVTREALRIGADELIDIVPRQLAAHKGFTSKPQAIREIHYPQSPESAKQARQRLAYEELLIFQTAIAIQRSLIKKSKGYSFQVSEKVENRIKRLFPFDLTDAQQKVIAELRNDLRAPIPMHRLLQGDVGCGKTVVAIYAILSVLAGKEQNYQTAFMAPTEVLAEQHYLTLRKTLAKADLNIALLKGGNSGSERRETLEGIAGGKVDLVVGTHALIQESVNFKNLALAVIDEQQRFGVRQRFELAQKGRQPDILLMTATPIPRTLTLACFGDMDVSIIDEMPPERQHVKTSWLARPNWKYAYKMTRRELRAGRRAFIIFPIIESNEKLELTSATEAYEKVKEGVFRNFSCCLLHGQMSTDEKNEAMEGFRSGRYQVMVATTVVEVGVDVGEASVMIIQHAERLGLSQLHQLRGRIGRHKYPGHCYLLAEPTTDDAMERLEVLTATNDGFKIAEADLRLRGPGELFGTRQSGMPEFRCFDFSDVRLLNETRKDAFKLVEDDPRLEKPQNTNIKKAIKQKYSEQFELGSIG